MEAALALAVNGRGLGSSRSWKEPWIKPFMEGALDLDVGAEPQLSNTQPIIGHWANVFGGAPSFTKAGWIAPV